MKPVLEDQFLMEARGFQATDRIRNTLFYVVSYSELVEMCEMSFIHSFILRVFFSTQLKCIVYQTVLACKLGIMVSGLKEGTIFITYPYIGDLKNRCYFKKE